MVTGKFTISNIPYYRLKQPGIVQNSTGERQKKIMNVYIYDVMSLHHIYISLFETVNTNWFFSLKFPDIYVCMVSATHNVSAKGFYVAMVSTTVETKNPEAELKPGLDLLGEIREKYVSLLLLIIVIIIVTIVTEAQICMYTDDHGYNLALITTCICLWWS